MKKIVKERLEKIVNSPINNEVHALVLLKNRLKDLGAEIEAEVCMDIPMALDFLKIFDDSIGDLSDEFYNSLMFDDTPKRDSRLFKPKKSKMDRDLLENIADSIVKMYPEGVLKYNILTEGFSILHESNAVICTTKRWANISAATREYSAMVILNRIKDIDEFTELIPERYRDGKWIGRVEVNKNIAIKYLTSSELIDIFADIKIVDKLC